MSTHAKKSHRHITQTITTATTATTPAIAAPAPVVPLSASLLTPSMEEYQRFLPAATALPVAEVRSARISVNLVLANAARGVAALQARRAEVAALPGIALDKIDSLAALGSALAYAANIVERFTPVVGDKTAAIAKARKIRGVLLAKADVLVLDGVVPASAVADIRKGKGALDTAEDCVALAALFVQYKAALPGRVQVSEDDILAADAIGQKLRVTLRPAAGKRTPSPELVAASDARDRLWTLFEQTWDEHVWPAAAFLYKRAALEENAPALQSRVVGHRAGKTPAPVPAATTAQTAVAA